MGKMVDAQSIVVASTATNFYGEEGKYSGSSSSTASCWQYSWGSW